MDARNGRIIFNICPLYSFQFIRCTQDPQAPGGGLQATKRAVTFWPTNCGVYIRSTDPTSIIHTHTYASPDDTRCERTVSGRAIPRTKKTSAVCEKTRRQPLTCRHYRRCPCNLW